MSERSSRAVGRPRVSVIVPTFNRPERLAHTLQFLRQQTLPADQYELIIVDDGSTPPVNVSRVAGGPRTTLIRFDDILERCIARNVGAERARGEILVFLDDDLEVGPTFLESHLRAHEEWPGAMVAGAVILPPGELSRPFVRFRQALEAGGAPPRRGVCDSKTVGAAGNLSMARSQYLALGGQATNLVGIEDVDFTHRHNATGRPTVYLPEAVAIHWDHALDLAPYYRRTEWAAMCTVGLVRRYPDWPENQARERINGWTRWGQEPFRDSLKKSAKWLLSSTPFRQVLFATIRVLEKIAPGTRLLDSCYRVVLGVAWLRGFRRGLQAQPAPSPPLVRVPVGPSE